MMITEREKLFLVCVIWKSHYAFSRCFNSDLQYRNINSVTEQTTFTLYCTMSDLLERYEMQRINCH